MKQEPKNSGQEILSLPSAEKWLHSGCTPPALDNDDLAPCVLTGRSEEHGTESPTVLDNTSEQLSELCRKSEHSLRHSQLYWFWLE